MKKNYSSGFTLIELLVVSTIIVVLATIGLVSYSQASKGARDGKRKADVETIRQAATLYRQQYATYPASISSMAGTYLSEPIPADPNPGVTGDYVYAGGATFCICAGMEATSPKGNSTNSSCGGIGTTTTGSHYCAKNL